MLQLYKSISEYYKRETRGEVDSREIKRFLRERKVCASLRSYKLIRRAIAQSVLVQLHACTHAYRRYYRSADLHNA